MATPPGGIQTPPPQVVCFSPENLPHWPHSQASSGVLTVTVRSDGIRGKYCSIIAAAAAAAARSPDVFLLSGDNVVGSSLALC